MKRQGYGSDGRYDIRSQVTPAHDRVRSGIFYGGSIMSRFDSWRRHHDNEADNETYIQSADLYRGPTTSKAYRELHDRMFAPVADIEALYRAYKEHYRPLMHDDERVVVEELFWILL